MPITAPVNPEATSSTTVPGAAGTSRAGRPGRRVISSWPAGPQLLQSMGEHGSNGGGRSP